MCSILGYVVGVPCVVAVMRCGRPVLRSDDFVDNYWD